MPKPGTEVTLVWGEEGGGSTKPTVERHTQIEIRATVGTRAVRRHRTHGVSAARLARTLLRATLLPAPPEPRARARGREAFVRTVSEPSGSPVKMLVGGRPP